MSALERFAAAVMFVTAITIFAVLGARWYGAVRYSVGYAAATIERAQADAAAVESRKHANLALEARQSEVNAALTKDKNDEITDLRKRLAAAGRLRVGSAVCPDRPAAPAQAEGTTGSDSADPSAGLVSAAADRDFKRLIEDVETDLATGRACQAFVRDNGMVP